MRAAAYRGCLWVAAACLAVAALFQLASYFTASIAVANSGLEPGLQQSFRALWLGSALQSMLLALIFGVAGWRPGAVSRAVVLLCGLLPIASAALFFTLVGSGWGQSLTALAAIAVVAGSLIGTAAGKVPA